MITYRIDPDRRLVTVTAMGALPADAVSANQAELRAAPGFDPSYALLADFTRASFAAFEPGDVRQHAAQDPFGPTSPRAVVVRQDADRGIVRMFEIYSELHGRTGPVRAFTDIPNALTWIESLRK
jgi:hypothetical protein